MRLLLTFCIMLLSSTPAVAASAGKATLYLDGARFETEAVASKGYVEVPIPAAMETGSLRIRPLRGTLARVEVVPARHGTKREREVARQVERKEQIAARLKALDVREEIFRAAAKSQSGKAPRKSKTNREPLEEIRKGTEFAMSQLESVYRAQRQARDELKVVENRLSLLREPGNTGSIARIWFAGKDGRAVVSWLQAAQRWTPVYDFRLLSRTEGELTLNALLPKFAPGTAVAVVPALLAEGSAQKPLAASSEGVVPITSLQFTVQNEDYSPDPQPAVSFSFVNGSGKLPPGEATCYRLGVYLGKVLFPGSVAGEVREVAFGRVSRPAGR